MLSWAQPLAACLPGRNEPRAAAPANVGTVWRQASYLNIWKLFVNCVQRFVAQLTRCVTLYAPQVQGRAQTCAGAGAGGKARCAAMAVEQHTACFDRPVIAMKVSQRGFILYREEGTRGVSEPHRKSS